MGSHSKNVTFALIILFLATLLTIPPIDVKASPKTIAVPEDYPTIKAAIENAADGDTIFVKRGTYQESPINTTKSISIISEGSQFTNLNFNCPAFSGEIYGFNITTYGRAINVNADNFTLSGFTVNTNGGDTCFSGNDMRIINNKISAPFSVNGYHVAIVNNTFLKAHFNSGWGVNFNYPFQLSLNYSLFSQNTILYDKSNCPVTFNGKYDIITDNKISGAVVYIVSTPCFFSGNTISNSLDWVTVISSNSIVTKNTIDNVVYGFEDEGSNNTIFANLITNCGNAYTDPSTHFWPQATFPGNESSTIYGNNFINNFRNIDCLRIAKIDSFNSGEIGNYWSDYTGTDSNGDGVGDTLYNIDTNRTDSYPLIAPFNISVASNLMPSWAQSLTFNLSPTDDGSNANPSPTSSASSPTPTVPELSVTLILSIFIAAISTAAILTHKKRFPKASALVKIYY